MSMFTRPSSGSSPASNPTTPIRMITTPTTPAYVLAIFFRPPCKDRSSTQSPAATAEKLADSLTFLPYLLSDGPLRRPEANLRVGAVAERLCRRTPTAPQRYGLPLSGEPVALGIDDHRALHQVRSVVEGSDLCLFGHNHPPCTLPPVTTRDHALRSLSALAIESSPSSLFVGRSLTCRMFGERVGGVQVCPVSHPHAQPFDQLAAEPARHHRQTRPQQGENNRGGARLHRRVHTQEPAHGEQYDHTHA